MPLDPFFSSKFKSKWKPKYEMAAVHKRSWPVNSQYKCEPGEKKAGIEMRHEHDLPDWFHVVDVPESKLKTELAAWRDVAPGWEFRRLTVAA